MILLGCAPGQARPIALRQTSLAMGALAATVLSVSRYTPVRIEAPPINPVDMLYRGIALTCGSELLERSKLCVLVSRTRKSELISAVSLARKWSVHHCSSCPLWVMVLTAAMAGHRSHLSRMLRSGLIW
jgi:hypothetical protein